MLTDTTFDLKQSLLKVYKKWINAKINDNQDK